MTKKQRNKYDRRKRYWQNRDRGYEKTTTYLDKYGYLRFKDTDRLVHRVVAYQIWLSHRKEYPLAFSCYEIHHKDGMKTNNNPKNLELLTKAEHAEIHPHLQANQRDLGLKSQLWEDEP
jgi:hypothetical protein